MALFALSDPHLCLSVDKPMDIFGARWTNYVEKLRVNWEKTVSDDDTVVIPGDISWAMKLNDAVSDFAFIEKLPGRKIIGKGNHDYFWQTQAKINEFILKNGFATMKFLFNNAFAVGDTVVCGSRGWYLDEEKPGCDSRKIVNRECMRLSASIKAADELSNGGRLERVAFLHYPPVFGEYVCDQIVDVLASNGINRCFYGHIHGGDMSRFVPSYNGISFTLVSCDHIDFTPVRVD